MQHGMPSNGSSVNPSLVTRDIGGPFLGIAKGISNGDFARTVLEIAGLRQPPGKENGPQPDIPWPTFWTQALNNLDQTMSRLVHNFQEFMRRVDSNRIIG